MAASGWTRIVPVICATVVAQLAWAQNYPTRPIRVVTTPAGGNSDFAARLIAQGLMPVFNQQLIVDNRGGGILAMEIVAKAPADGHTLLYIGSTMWLLPLMREVSYDAVRDFTPVTLALNSPGLLAVNASLPAKSVKDLIALAKARPGVLNYGSGTAGGPAHLSVELLKSLAGLDIVRVPFKGTGGALTALIAGEIQLLMSSSASVAPHIKSGKVRVMAVTGAKRSASFPDLPTVAESGVPGYEYGQMSGIFAPAKTPAAIVDRLSRETARFVNLPDVRQKLFNTGADPEGTTPQEAAARIKSEIVRLGKVIKDANIREE